MSAKLVITRLLARWLPTDLRQKSIVLLDVIPDIPKVGTLRLDLNVSFKPIPFPKGFLSKRYFYVGSTIEGVTVTFEDGTVASYTRERPIIVRRGVAVGRNQAATIRVAPPGMDSPEVSYQRGSSIDLVSEYTDLEFTLTPNVMANEVSWEWVMPEGLKVIRHFLSGNLFLFAECKWNNSGRKGRIHIWYDFAFFSHRGRPLGRDKSLTMAYTLRKIGKGLYHPTGFDLDFQVKENNL